MTNLTVRAASELASALAVAKGGDVISLAPGDYGDIVVNRAYSGLVTITSLDPQMPAHIKTANVMNAQNVLFSYLDMGGPLGPTKPNYTPVAEVSGGNNISFDHVHVHGSLDNDPSNDGHGLRFLSSTNVSVTNSEFEQLARAVGFGDVMGATASGNDFHDLRTHGIEVGGAQNLNISSNKFRDFYWNTGDHFDAIQVHTAGASIASHDISITDNVILQGKGLGVQGIFVQDETGTSPYQNLTISNNLVYMSVWDGIVVRGASSIDMSNNTVLTPETDTYQSRIWLEGVTSGVLRNNFGDVIHTTDSAANVSAQNNISLSDSPRYADLVPNINAGKSAVANDLIIADAGYHLVAASSPTPVSPGSPDPQPAPLPSSTPAPAPTPTPTPVPAPASPHLIYGTVGSDKIYGTSGSDKVWGVSVSGLNPGRGSVDLLYGRGGSDTFVIGDTRGLFYDDDNAKNAGKNDYAQIRDFGSDDYIQLHGQLSDFIFKTGVVNGQQGLQIFLDSNGNDRYDSKDELIAHVVGVSSIVTDHFTFG